MTGVYLIGVEIERRKSRFKTSAHSISSSAPRLTFFGNVASVFTGVPFRFPCTLTLATTNRFRLLPATLAAGGFDSFFFFILTAVNKKGVPLNVWYCVNVDTFFEGPTWHGRNSLLTIIKSALIEIFQHYGRSPIHFANQSIKIYG